MKRQIIIDAIQISGFNTPCAHHCRYCAVGKQKGPTISFSRFVRVAERFQDWVEARQSNSLKVRAAPSFSFNFDLETTAHLAKLWWRLDQCAGFNALLMGGLPLRSQDEMRNWLIERQTLGLKMLVPSLAGIGETHDYYNRRIGDFQFLIDTLRTGSELGLQTHQRLFLTKRTLPQIEQLAEILGSLSLKVASRQFYPLFYRGLADQLEDDRLTEDMLNKLPQSLVELCGANTSWHSEREWIAQSETGNRVESESVWLRLHLDASNIETIESMAVEDIFVDLEHRTRAAYAAVPTREELAQSVGDTSNTRVYANQQDIERLWLDRYLRDHAIKFERELTYFL